MVRLFQQDVVRAAAAEQRRRTRRGASTQVAAPSLSFAHQGETEISELGIRSGFEPDELELTTKLAVPVSAPPPTVILMLGMTNSMHAGGVA